METALSQPAAQTMDVSVGDEPAIAGRLDHRQVPARLTGIFQLDDPYSERRGDDELLRRGVEHGDHTTGAHPRPPNRNGRPISSEMIRTRSIRVRDYGPVSTHASPTRSSSRARTARPSRPGPVRRPPYSPRTIRPLMI
ncbi:hypothetical protein [Sphaerisporangium fuscum]|uniref:hypothetical protein n=1 Tax=Sphaerisporangium fuscum TaxID=2835868 RepID=UPI001BDC741C|nr:hypothetical protein [Sphaerisporangium fuscum]